MDEAFRAEMAAGYTFDEPVIILGSPIQGDEVLPEVRVSIPLSRVNRHGLIAGATGTGKTKTLQLLAGQLSDAGVPVFAVDVKGDLSGVGAAGDPTNKNVVDRSASLQWTFESRAHPIEVLSLSGTQGAHVRASVSSFGPLLLGKVLDLNETQTVDPVARLPVLRRRAHAVESLRRPPDHNAQVPGLGPGQAGPRGPWRHRPGVRLGVILRAIVTIEQEGADVFFGEPEFEVKDLVRGTPWTGRGIVTLLEVADVMDRPRLYSTFVLWMLAQLYEPAARGRRPGPSPPSRSSSTRRTCCSTTRPRRSWTRSSGPRGSIRSKGVGVYFVTQAPTDVPSPVLSQLGNRIQHALRAFTPDDTAMRCARPPGPSPMTHHYDVERTITSLGIGEALVTVLSRRAPDAARGHAHGPAGLADGAADARGGRRAGRGVAVAARYGTDVDPEWPTRSSPGAYEREGGAATARRRRPARPGLADDGQRPRGDDAGPAAAGDRARRARELEAPRKGAERERKGARRRLPRWPASASGRCGPRSTRSGRCLGRAGRSRSCAACSTRSSGAASAEWRAGAPVGAPAARWWVRGLATASVASRSCPTATEVGASRTAPADTSGRDDCRGIRRRRARRSPDEARPAAMTVAASGGGGPGGRGRGSRPR